MSYEMLKALIEASEKDNQRIYTIPKSGERWRASQIEGMALFTLSLHLAYDWYQANQLGHTCSNEGLELKPRPTTGSCISTYMFD